MAWYLIKHTGNFTFTFRHGLYKCAFPVFVQEIEENHGRYVRTSGPWPRFVPNAVQPRWSCSNLLTSSSECERAHLSCWTFSVQISRPSVACERIKWRVFSCSLIFVGAQVIISVNTDGWSACVNVFCSPH